MHRIIEEDCARISQNIGNFDKINGKTFVIAGANSFIARYIIYALLYMNEHCLAVPCRVIGLCRNKNKADKFFDEFEGNPFLNIVNQDITEPFHFKFEGKADYVIHAASLAASDQHRKFPVETITANTVGSYNILDFCRKHQTSAVLYLSSGAVQGEPFQESDVRNEDVYYPLDPTDTSNFYAEAKRCGESLFCAFYQEYGLEIKIARISHTYGPGIDLNDGHIYSDFIRNILNNEDLLIKGDGLQCRPFCYVSDTVVGLFMILLNGKSGEPYTLANSSQHMSMKELARRLTEQAFPEKELKVIIRQPREEKTKTKAVMNEKLKMLGWNPEVDVVEGFKRTVESFVIIPGGYYLTVLDNLLYIYPLIAFLHLGRRREVG